MNSFDDFEQSGEFRELDVIEVRKLQLTILDKVCSFCKENGIKVFLMYGSLLGAIREKGYIPWDDDVDICMLRDEYERFLELFPKLQKELVVRELTLEDDFPFFFAKICMPNTYLYEAIGDKKFNVGINIDLFPMDNVPDDARAKDRMYKKINSIRRKLIPATIDRTVKRPLHKRVVLKAMELIYNKPIAYYYKKLHKVVKEYGKQDSTRITEIMTPYGERALLDRQLFDNAITVGFEDITVPVPERYDEILKKIYGNYMQRPPKDKQITHHSFKAYVKTGD